MKTKPAPCPICGNDDPCYPLEWAVLHALPGQHRHPDFDYGFFHSLRVIADDAGVDKEAARFACRRLRDKGLALYQSGLFNEDGEVAGSGYALTDKGRALIAQEDKNDGI